MKIVFMGTPDFAVAALRELHKSHEIAAVVTQPDRQKGRGNKVQAPPVKEFALRNSIPVFQPEKVNTKEFIEILRGINADIFVVAAFGQLLKDELLYMPKYGAINIHASLLPKYRGASPIQQAILHGDSVTGVTIMQMDKGLDTGHMILKSEVKIEPSDNSAALHDKLADSGAKAALEALDLIFRGEAVKIKQDDTLSSYAPLIKKSHALIDWSKPAEDIINLIRAFNPWPAAYSYFKGQVLKIFEAELFGEEYSGDSGEIVAVIKNRGFVVKAGEGAVIVRQIQAPGGKRLDAGEYIKGADLAVGDKFSGQT